MISYHTAGKEQLLTENKRNLNKKMKLKITCNLLHGFYLIIYRRVDNIYHELKEKRKPTKDY